MTGKHNGHAFIRGNKEIEPEGQVPMPADTFTVAHHMQRAGYATGQAPFDAAKVKGHMGGIAAAGKKLQGLYPAGSGGDPKSSADPKIWTNKADFTKRLTEMSTLATKAGAAKSADEFKPAFSALSATCKSCHDIYRKKKA